MPTNLDRWTIELRANNQRFRADLAMSQKDANRWSRGVQSSVRNVFAAFGTTLAVSQLKELADAQTNVANRIALKILTKQLKAFGVC